MWLASWILFVSLSLNSQPRLKSCSLVTDDLVSSRTIQLMHLGRDLNLTCRTPYKASKEYSRKITLVNLPSLTAIHRPNRKARPVAKGRNKKTPSNSPGKVMSVQADPFSRSFDHWPASEETWDVVFAVSNSILKSQHDVPLWANLTPEQKAHLFVQWHGRCLNCGCTSHSMRDCSLSFLNVSGALNSDFRYSPNGHA